MILGVGGVGVMCLGFLLRGFWSWGAVSGGVNGVWVYVGSGILSSYRSLARSVGSVEAFKKKLSLVGDKGCIISEILRLFLYAHFFWFGLHLMGIV